MISGKYTVRADELSNALQTVVATATVNPCEITVLSDSLSYVAVNYSPPRLYCALDVMIWQLLPPLDGELLRVTVTDEDNDTIADFLSTHKYKTELRRLPSSGTAKITAELTVNNVRYSATKLKPLANELVEAQLTQDDVKIESVESPAFFEVSIALDTDLIKPATKISLRLSSISSAWLYTQEVVVRAGTSKFDLKIAPGEYRVEAKGFFDGSIVYAVLAPETLIVASNTTLSLQTKRGANLSVRGFPDFLSWGAISDLSDLSGAAFVNARASSVFKYAGNDGAGDWAGYRTEDPATKMTVELANTIATTIGGNHKVLPIMVAYTCNLSLGDVPTRLANAEWHKHSLANLILSLRVARETAQDFDTSLAPAGFILNADFLGECQKHELPPTYYMPVREPLSEALRHREVPGRFPGDLPYEITDTLKGYVAAVNWLVSLIAIDVTYGWQVNVWGVGNSEWVYSRDPTKTPAKMAKETADYIKLLGVHSGTYRPHFLAIDRYEADDFTQRAYTNSYCYGPYEWGQFYNFVGALSLEMEVPVMPWQIPASRIPNRNEPVLNLEVENWGSGGTHLFGDPLIANDYRNIHPTILGIKQTSLVPHEDVEGLFKSAQPFDMSFPTFGDFLYRGIFTTLLGGGATTGIIENVGKTGRWTQEKLKAYMENPIPIQADTSRPTRPKHPGSKHPGKLTGKPGDPYCPYCDQLLPQFRR